MSKRKPEPGEKRKPAPRKGCPCGRTCCDRAAPRSYVDLAHERGEYIDLQGPMYEAQWWFECWTCGAVCKCEV